MAAHKFAHLAGSGTCAAISYRSDTTRPPVGKARASLADPDPARVAHLGK